MRGSTAGLTDGAPRVLAFLDVVAASTVIAPAVIGYWRGTWCLMDLGEAGWAPSLGIGVFGHLFFTLFQERMDSGSTSFTRMLSSRIYTAAFGFCCVNSWRGVWKLLDDYTGYEITHVIATTALGVGALAAMRTLRNISAPPFAVLTDVYEGYFVVPTMFRVSSARDTWLYVLDCLFSVVIVGTLVVFVWRGAWTLLDIYVYPNHPDWSAWASLALGYGIVLFTFSLQKPMKYLCGRLKGLPRIVVIDIYLLFSFAGTVNLWRGVWNLLNVYFLVELPLVSYWISHVVCLLMLMILNCSNSILVRGVYIDGEEQGGKAVVFPIYYLRLFFQKRRLQHLEKIHEEHLQQSKKRQASVGSADGDPPPAGVNHLVLAPLMDTPESVI